MQEHKPNGFRKPKALNKKQEELVRKTTEFRDGYLELCKRTGLSLGAVIQSMGSQAIVKMQLQKFVDNSPKAWSDSLKENLAVQQTCNHKSESLEIEACKICTVDKKYWAESHTNDELSIYEGQGVTVEYTELMEKRIADEKAKENAKVGEALAQAIKEDDSVKDEEINSENVLESDVDKEMENAGNDKSEDVAN